MDIPEGYERHLYEWTLTGRGEIPLSSEAEADLAAHPDELRRMLWFGVRTMVEGREAPPPGDALAWKELRTPVPMRRTTINLEESVYVEAKAMRLNISAITRDALRRVIAANTKGAV